MTILYRIYQLFVAIPLIVLATVLTALVTIVGCFIGNGHFWGYYPGKCWSWFIIRILFLPIKVEGRENLQPGQSYVFAANHQGAFDIFMIYGFLGRNFKWMMKQSLRKIPLDQARQTLHNGMSLVIFPEGARTFTGHLGVFKRGAFMLADELQLPIVPVTINGSFDVMPRTRDLKWVHWHRLKLTIHAPIMPIGQGTDNTKFLEEQSYEVIMGSLVPEYQGFVPNPDQ